MSPAAIEALIILAAKYGPQLILDIEQVFQKKDATLSDFASLFKDLKPYSAYNIPTSLPTQA